MLSRRPVVAILMLSLALAAVGCGSGDDEQQTASRTRLTILAEDVPSGLDYDGPAVGIPTSQTGMVNLMEGLLTYAPAGQNDEGVRLLDFAKYEGRLAESWDYDPATLTWTFHLRQGVVGCDGATFNADDVIYTFARAKSVSGQIPLGWFEANTAGIDGFTPDVITDKSKRTLGDEVVKVDDHTVKIRQSRPPSQLFLPVLAQWAGVLIFDKETMEANKTDKDPWSHEYTNNVNAPSFGPYCLKTWEKNNQFVVTANPRYYRGAPAIQEIVYRKVPESANRVAALRSGDADLVEHLTPKEFDALRNADGIKVSGVIGNETLLMHLNWKTKPFDDVRVRQAFAHAIPYDQIITNGYASQAKKWEGQVSSTYPGYHRPAKQYDADPARARELLAQAGFPEGRGLDRFASAFRLTYTSEKESTLGPIATLIQASLREVGFPVELDPIPQTQFADRLYTKHDLSLALDDIEKAVPVDGGYALLIAHTTYGCCANNGNFADPRVDELVKAANVETDQTKRSTLLAHAQDILMDRLSLLPIVEYKTQWASRDDVRGITWHPENSLRWSDLSAGG
jgi:peptide/nickel transport system substrate-binding protein